MTGHHFALYTVATLVLVMADRTTRSVSRDRAGCSEEPPKPRLIWDSEWKTGSDVEKDCVACSITGKAIVVTNSGSEFPFQRPDCPQIRKKDLMSRAAGDDIRKSYHQWGGVSEVQSQDKVSRKGTADELKCFPPDQLQREGDSDKPGQRKNFKDGRERLGTFYSTKAIRWPRTVPSAESLARQGFVYTGQDVTVECHVCGAKISNWDDGKDPLLKHFTQQPRCQFLQDNFKPQLEGLSCQLGSSSSDRKYANTSLRLQSFEHWPLSHAVSSYQLATVGFYYTGRGAEVRCFACGVSYDRWKPRDVPLLIHRQLSPLCQFLQQLLSRDSPPPAPLDLSPPSPLPSHPPTASHADLSRPDYANEQVRLKSFKYLPRGFPCSKEDCARAGLYFVRKPDVMKCFSCDAVVKDWVRGDVAVEKHREVSPHCRFLREFYASKFDSASSEEGLDPSSLPEPQFSRQQLQALSRRNTSASSAASQFDRLSLSDTHPSFLPTYPPSSHPLSYPTPYHHSTSIPTEPHHYQYVKSKSMQARPYTYTTPPVPRPHHREEYVGPSMSRLRPSPLATRTPHPYPSGQGKLLEPSLVNEPSVSLPPPSQPARPQAMNAPPPTEDSKLCVVCMDEVLEVVLMPCGHVCACEQCSKQLTQCPMCRQPVDRAIRVFLPY